MQIDWSVAKLGDYVTHQKGFAFKSKDYKEFGYPVVRVSNFTERSIASIDLKYLSEDQVGLYSSYKLKTHDAVVATVGSWPTNPASVVGKTVSVPKNLDGALLNQNAVSLRAVGELDQRYLFYLLKTDEYQRYIVSTAQGSANQASITLRAIFGFEFMRPSFKEQVAITRILTSLDDKIELNRQINETLEAMAQALFKSWFVDFDPVIDNALAAGNEIPEALQQRAEKRKALGDQRKPLPPEVQSLFPDRFVSTDEMGWVPEGWETTSFGQVSKCFDSKRIPLSKKQREDKKPGAIPYFGATSIMDYVNEWIFDDIYLLIGEDGSVMHEDGSPFIQYIWGKTWVNNHAHVLQGANGISTEHLKLFISQQNIAAYVTGAVQLKINQKNMNSIPFLKASDELNNYFAHQVKPSYKKIIAISEEIRSLTKLRDALLPKLLSGELRIPDAEKQVAEVL